MIKNIFILTLLLIVTSCERNDIESLTVYKSKGLTDMPYDVLESTFWDYKNYNDLDSLNVSNDNVLLFGKLFNSIDKKHSADIPFLHPEYAMVIRYKLKNDTIYLDEMIMNGYTKNKDFNFIDSKSVIYNFLKNEGFLSERTKYFRSIKDSVPN